MRAPTPFHNSVPVPLATFQILSLVLVAETYRRKSGPSRGEDPVLVVNEIRTGADVAAGETPLGKRPKGLLGLATVRIRRRPSAPAPSDGDRASPGHNHRGSPPATPMLKSPP